MSFHSLFRTSLNDTAALVARLGLGIVIGAHGAQKALGALGGPGWNGAVQFLSGVSGSAIIANLVIVGEFVGSIALILGLLSRFCAAAIAVIMIGAITLVHLPNGLVGQGGYELHVLAIALAIVVVIRGGGRLSIDGMISKNM